MTPPPPLGSFKNTRAEKWVGTYGDSQTGEEVVMVSRWVGKCESDHAGEKLALFPGGLVRTEVDRWVNGQ